MEEILSYLILSEIELVLLAIFFILFLLQILFYLIYFRYPLRKYRKSKKEGVETSNKKPSVSVILISKNESENLANNLPFILEQDYSDFEVVVVNDGSTDESEYVLQNLSRSHTNLYHTFSPDSRDRKLSMTIGIKAAKNEILLFTEAACRLESKYWISSMISALTDEKSIVLGYSYFKGNKSFFRQLANFDNLFFSLKYLSKALHNSSFAATYRNLAFRKKLFFDNRGFSKVLNFENCEEVFVNRVMDTSNTAIALNEESFVSMSLDSYSTWRGLKVSYFRSQANFQNSGGAFSFELYTRYLFYILFAGMLVFGVINQSWFFISAIALLFLIRWLIQFLSINKMSKHFKTPKYFLSVFVFDIIQPLVNGWFKLASRKKDNQKYKSSHM